MNTSTVKFTIETLDDSDPDTSYLSQDYLDVPDAAERQKYLAQDAARLAAYKRGDWHYIGVRARATITIHDSVDRSTWQHDLTSCGLWGVESDSGEEYIRKIFEEECEQLRSDLEAVKTLSFADQEE